MKLQENKVTNIMLACNQINGIVIHPGETFSYCQMVGRPTKERGFKEGLVIGRKGMSKGYGGGLCQMANMIHWLVLNSPLEVTELHHHSDALFPDDRRRVPFGTGTSVTYNALDYRFKNNTDQDVQILVWCENGELCGELRSEREFPCRYKLVEENHHFSKENGINCYRTGDLGHISSGKLYYDGRKDFQVKYKGYRIELNDIEKNINKINGVSSCIVIAKYNDEKIVKSIKAFVVVDGNINEEYIKNELRKIIPGYMMPKIIKIVDKLPLNNNGKIDRKKLEEL